MIGAQLWYVKAVGLNVLSRLPFHEEIHYAAQKLLGRHKLDAPEMFGRAVELFQLLRHGGGSVRNADVLEIGTGWFPFTAMISRLLGASSVLTVDIHPWLRLGNSRRTIVALTPFLDELADKAGEDRDMVRTRHTLLLAQAQAAQSLEELLAAAGIVYRTHFDVSKSGLPGESIGVVLSSNVMEHIPPPGLRAVHTEMARLLKPDGFAVHRFNPGDHFREITGSTINFLRYSDKAWRRLGGYGLSYHNRLRSAQHTQIFEECGLPPVLWADHVDIRAVGTIRRGDFPLAAEFARFPLETLCASYSWFVLTRRAKTPVAREPLLVRKFAEVVADAAENYS